jgi:predicted transcriptional regulator
MSDKNVRALESTVDAMIERRKEKFNAYMKEIEGAEADIKRIRAKISDMDVEFQKSLQAEFNIVVDKVRAEILAKRQSKEGEP